MGLRDAVWQYSLRHDLLAPGRAVLLGVSGGPDSLALLDALAALAAAHGFALAAAHLNHGLRPEAADEAAFVQAEAAARGVPTFTETADTTAYAAEHKLSVEAAARAVRYAFLARAARQAGAPLVAVAHTADDQAETVLMHLLRGSGLAGLRGMLARSGLEALPRAALGGIVPGEGAEREGRPADALPLTLIRPLLATTRAEVLAYCAEHGLQPRHDPSNTDVRYTRNRLRHGVLPALERENPNLRATLARTAAVLAGEFELAERHLDALWPQVARAGDQRPGQVVFARAAWPGLAPAERRGLLRRAAAQVLGEARDLDFEPLDAAARFAAEAPAGRTADLPRGLRLAVEADRLVVYRGARADPDYPLLLEPDGRLPAGWRLATEAVEGAPDPLNPWEAVVATAALTGALTVRGRRRGERFQPLGMGGRHMALADYMKNSKIAARARDRWPVVACGAAVVWLPGLRLDERFRVEPATTARTRLWFVFEPPEQP